MRELRFKRYVMHCVGGIWTRGTLKNLLLAMPYVLHRFIPPFHVLSYLLQHGVPNEFFPDGLLPNGKVQYDAGRVGVVHGNPLRLHQRSMRNWFWTC